MTVTRITHDPSQPTNAKIAADVAAGIESRLTRELAEAAAGGVTLTDTRRKLIRHRIIQRMCDVMAELIAEDVLEGADPWQPRVNEYRELRRIRADELGW